MQEWASASTWTGDGLRREVTFFPSGRDEIYASLYAAEPPRLPVGVVVCPSWGHDVMEQLELTHRLAHAIAARGGAGLAYHPPGHADSGGRFEEATFERLAEAARDALALAVSSVPEVAWEFGGVDLGAAVAVLAAARNGRILPLVEPALDPAAHLGVLERAARRAALGRVDPEPTVFGYPLTRRIRASAAALDVAGALESFGGRVAAFRHRLPERPPLPERVETHVVPGEWRRPVHATNVEALVTGFGHWVAAAVAAA